MDEPGLALPRRERLRKRREFLQVYADGVKIHTPFFVLYIAENRRENSRLGMTVSRRIGKASVRNRVKRRLREAYRRNRSGLPAPSDLVFNVKRAAAAASWRELENSFCEAMKSWKRKRLPS